MRQELTETKFSILPTSNGSFISFIGASFINGRSSSSTLPVAVITKPASTLSRSTTPRRMSSSMESVTTSLRIPRFFLSVSL